MKNGISVTRSRPLARSYGPSATPNSFRGLPSRSSHPEHPSVADEMFLKVGVDRALAAQPGKRFFSLATQMNVLGQTGFRWRCWRVALDADLDQLRARGVSGTGHREDVDTAGSDNLGLGARRGREHSEDGGEVFVREFRGVAGHEATDEAARDAGEIANVGLALVTRLGSALESDGEITHGEGKAEGKMMNAEWDRKDE